MPPTISSAPRQQAALTESKAERLQRKQRQVIDALKFNDYQAREWQRLFVEVVRQIPRYTQGEGIASIQELADEKDEAVLERSLKAYSKYLELKQERTNALASIDRLIAVARSGDAIPEGDKHPLVQQCLRYSLKLAEYQGLLNQEPAKPTEYAALILTDTTSTVVNTESPEETDTPNSGSSTAIVGVLPTGPSQPVVMPAQVPTVQRDLTAEEQAVYESRIEDSQLHAKQLAIALELETSMYEGWELFMGVLTWPIPKASKAELVTGQRNETKRQAQIHMLNNLEAALIKHHHKLLVSLQPYISIVKKYPDYRFQDELYKSRLVDALIDYRKAYLGYLDQFKKAADNSIYIDSFTTQILTEGSEELMEHITPLSKEWSVPGTRWLNESKLNISIADISLKVEERLLNAGAKDIPKLRTILQGSGNFFRDTLEGMRPDSYFTVLIYAYYVHMAEDKTKAALQFANFMVMSGLSNAALGVAQRMLLASNNLKWLAAVPGNPVVKIVAAIGLTIGLDKLIGFDEKLELLKRQFNAGDWEAGGIVFSVLGGETLFDQIGEIGYMTGLNTVHPEKEQESFLGQRVLMASQEDSSGNTKGNDHFWLNHAHTLRDWDDQVDRAIARTTDPAEKQLWATQYIYRGPGGVQGWMARQANKYYTEWAALRGFEENLDQLAAELGLNHFHEVDEVNPEAPRMPHRKFALHKVLTSAAPDDVYGSKGLTNSSEYVRLKAEIKRLKKEKPNDPRVRALEILVNHALERVEHLAKLRATYVHLDLFSRDWLDERVVGEGDQKKTLIPKIVEDGMYSLMALNSQRLTKLAPNIQVETITTKMPPFSITTIPAIIQHIADYMEREREVIFTYQQKLSLQHQVRMMATQVPQDKHYEVFGVLQQAVAEQSNLNLISPEDISNALNLAYVEHMLDGDLRQVERTPSGLSVGNQYTDTPEERVLPNLYVYGGIDSESFNVNVPQRTFGFSEPELPESPKYETPRAQVAHAAAMSHYNKMKALWDQFGVYSKAPVILSSKDFNGTQLDSVMSLEYDHEQGEMMVNIKTNANVPHFGGFLNFNQHDHLVAYEEWAKQHPKFAEQINTQVEAYKKQELALREYESLIEQDIELDTELRRAEELTDQEKVLVTAKCKPGVWHRFPMWHSTASRQDNRPRYEYVTYLEDRDEYMYLQVPNHYRNGPQLWSNEAHVRAKRGKDSYPQVTIERKDGSWQRWSLYGDYPEVDSSGDDIPISRFVNMLTLPIPGNEKQPVENIVAMYVQSLGSRHTIAIENDIWNLYRQLDSRRKQRTFLGFVQRELHEYTRKVEATGFLGLGKGRRTSDLGRLIDWGGYAAWGGPRGRIHSYAKETFGVEE